MFRCLLLQVCALAASVALTACGGCGVELAPDGGLPLPADAGVDAGGSGAWDASIQLPDAGPAFKPGFADEPCPEDREYSAPDGGYPDGTVMRGLCIALSTLQGIVTVDGQPATAGIHLQVEDLVHLSERDVIPEPTGHYALRFMQGRYDRLRLHPHQLGAHAGHKDFGPVDLRKDHTRDLPVKTWVVGGSAFFAGQPWPSSQQPPDLTLHADGSPMQLGYTANQHGAWQVRLMEGDFRFSLSVPYHALGETQLSRYPIKDWTTLNADLNLDINLPAAELSGQLTVDGQPFPDRLPGGPDYRLEFLAPGVADPVVTTVHQGGGSFYAALVPRGEYFLQLHLFDAADSQLPSTLFNKQLTASLDLNGDRTRNFDLRTHELEGALLIDGQPIQGAVGGNWLLYAYAHASTSEPWFLAYYRVPLSQSGFQLRALEGTYLMAVLLDSFLHPELAQGFFIAEQQLLVDRKRSWVIDVPTNVVEGTILVDGVPASSAHGRVGRLSFKPANGQRLTWDVVTTDGRFRVRLPREKYDIEFEIDPEAYPEHASGRHFTGATVDLTKTMDAPAEVTVVYLTVPVGGPFLFGRELLPDARAAFPEAQLQLRRVGSQVTFVKPLEGGQSHWFLRIPEGHYQLAFQLEPDVLADVAHGSAALGNNLLVK